MMPCEQLIVGDASLLRPSRVQRQRAHFGFAYGMMQQSFRREASK
eukprot:COSAG06_NODE_4974_length_3817_cov_1.671329_5_plen_45_part_00